MFLTYVSGTYLMTYGDVRCIIKYILQNVNIDHEKIKLNRNVHNTVRSLLYCKSFYKLKQGLIQNFFLSGSR